tara:strand:+ start:736 stop:924 length:189 start_codon:yes stop_codon:yes gene_type:complete
MKLSKVILENNKIISRKELKISENDIIKLTETIASKLDEYLDIDKKDILEKVVKEAITEIVK